MEFYLVSKNVVSFPLIIIFPEVGSSSFKISFISVDFPLPEEPTRKANSPLSITKLAFFTAFLSLYHTFFVTFLNSIIFCTPYITFFYLFIHILFILSNNNNKLVFLQ